MTPSLTPSELAVLQAAAEGLTARETAYQRKVSPHTVRSQRETAYRRLGVHTQAEAFRRLGWLRPGAGQ